MKITKYNYKKNLLLIWLILALVSILYIVAVSFARNLMKNYVENDFTVKKAEIFDKSVAQFNEFFQTKVPEISFYQGYLDSAEGRSYASSVLKSFPFVKQMLFYDLALSTRDKKSNLIGFSINSLVIETKSLHIYENSNGQILEQKLDQRKDMLPYTEDVNNMLVRLSGFIDKPQRITKLSDDDIFKVFYSVSAGKVSYLNIPRLSDLNAYKYMMDGQVISDTLQYEQDLFTFLLDPTLITLYNLYPNLYQQIKIVPLVRSSVEVQANILTTEIPLPGALAGYKLLFSSSKEFITKEVNRKFFPVIVGLSIIYLILLFVVYLIYNNIATNSRLFKLQYDFINNLTHEFKTPVSVIKIAGNNIKSATLLSDQERLMYGNILDQEADKLNGLMNKLLSFTQIENKSIKLKKERIDLTEFCQTMFAASKLKYTDLKLTYTIDVHNPLYADPVLLTSVFQNLIDNAYKYSTPSHKVLYIAIQQNKRNFVISFKDEGIGISKTEYANIFKKFYRIKSQYNQQGSIGLGLAFCKEITIFMGGDILVSSEEGKGTTFKLTFPVIEINDNIA